MTVSALFTLPVSLPVIFFASSCALAQSNGFYVELDAQMRRQSFNGGAQTLFKRDMPQANILVGLAFNSISSIELSYFQTQKMHSQRTLHDGDNYFGNVLGYASQRLNTNSISLDLVDSITTNNTSKLQGIKLGIKETLPLNKAFELTASINISRMTMKLSHDIIGYTTEDETGVPNQNNQLTFSKTKLIPSVSLGLQYCFTPNALLTANILWEQTRRFKNITPHQTNIRPGQSVVNANNSFVYSVGLRYRF